MPEVAALTFSEAHALLKQFDCLDHTRQSALDGLLVRAKVQQALRLVTELSDYQIFGVCADSFDQGMAALTSFLTALGYDTVPTLQPRQGTVYIKYKPNSGTCYVDSYPGNHRGVLVSCQSYYADGISETYGHLPLDLFTRLPDS
ncbi:MAG: DUF1824 family protein [Cyanobacteria bacterium]|nr:DUF1824 family protein [Cyanobacteriota bacterium]MDW8201134.1 DUF1824 family protein [Cyanobacteriota bacterium SKYGB_h_bin112]